jgi:beta-glucanase (GH16 family)
LGDKYISGAADEWHTYGLRWTDEYVEAFIDNVSLGTKYYNDQKGNFATWPYDQKFYIILNLAMGGDLGGSIDSSLTEAVYEIDYVRVYQ